MRIKLDLKIVESLVSYNKETGIFVSKTSRGCVKAGSVLDKKTDRGYVKFQICGKEVFAHRLAFLLVHGEQPEFIDHINGIRSDNRISNLRSVDKYENAFNAFKKSNGSSRFKGVSWKKNENKWTAQIRVQGKFIALGYFKNETEAAYFYDLASFKYHGEFGKRNFLPLVSYKTN